MMVRVCALSQRGRGAKYCDSLARPEDEEEGDMCTLIFSSAHLSEFGIEEGYLILDLPKNPFGLLYLGEEGGQNIVTV